MNRIEFIQSTLGISALFGLSLAACNDKENLQDLVNNTRLKVSGNMFNFSSNGNIKYRCLYLILKCLYLFLSKMHIKIA